jgi:hypothetical protein
VPRVCQQRQRVGREATNDLGNHVRRGQDECHGQPPSISGHLGCRRMMLVVLVPHLDSLLTTPPGFERFSVSSL